MPSPVAMRPTVSQKRFHTQKAHFFTRLIWRVDFEAFIRGRSYLSNTELAARPQNYARGITLIVVAMFVTSVQDVVFKLFSDGVPLGQIFAIRALLAAPLIIALARAQGITFKELLAGVQNWPLARSFAMTMMFLAFYTAIPFVNLSTLGAATYTAPIFVALLSAYVIGEKVTWQVWSAVIIGFAGVIVLLRPGTEAFNAWSLLPVFGAMFYAIAHVLTRAKCQAVPTVALAFGLNASMCLAGLLASALIIIWPPSVELSAAYPYLFAGWTTLGRAEWLVLVLLAALTVIISIGIAGAYQAAPPPTVATFEYSYLVFVAVWDTLFFATAPGLVTLIGMAMIILAGVLVLQRKE